MSVVKRRHWMLPPPMDVRHPRKRSARKEKAFLTMEAIAHATLLTLLVLRPWLQVCGVEPSYSDSYIPAASQVVYYLLDQLSDEAQLASPEVTRPQGGKEKSEWLSVSRVGESLNSKTPNSAAKQQLLGLHDALVKEAKSDRLSDKQGFSEDVLTELRASSSKTSAEQLEFVVGRALDSGDLRRESTKVAARKVLSELAQPESDLKKALKPIPPLQYA